VSLESFSRRIKIRANNLPGETNRVVKQCALAVDQTVVLATPVDTGRARSNWLVSLGNPVEQVIDPYQPLPKGTNPDKVGETGNARGAIEQGKQVITSRQPEQTVFITNNVDYIGYLNEGSSAQAPAMFVEAAVQAGVAAVRGARIDTGKR